MRKHYLSRKEEIVLTTISLIHELGVSNVSMKDISKREGVTDASLYKHFKSKDELLASVLEHYEQYDEYIRHTLLKDCSSAIEKLFKYFSIYSDYYNNYKEITSLIFSYDVFIHDAHFSEGEKNRKLDETNFLEKLIKEGQKEGILKGDFEPMELAYALMGSFEYTILMWRLKQYSFELPAKVNAIIGYTLRAYIYENNK